MKTFIVKVAVDYEFRIDAESEQDAADEGFNFKNYPAFGSVDFVKVQEITEGD